MREAHKTRAPRPPGTTTDVPTVQIIAVGPLRRERGALWRTMMMLEETIALRIGALLMKMAAVEALLLMMMMKKIMGVLQGGANRSRKMKLCELVRYACGCKDML